jgi:septum formation protein
MLDNLKNYKIVLGSQSPRRQELLKGIGINFETKVKEIDESFSPEMKKQEIPVYLSQQKAQAFEKELKEENILLITCDTIVWIDNHALNKAADRNEAIQMLNELSGNMHEVFTGVTLTSKEKSVSFFEETKVYFKNLSREEIEFYIDHYKPYDKAGS